MDKLSLTDLTAINNENKKVEDVNVTDLTNVSNNPSEDYIRYTPGKDVTVPTQKENLKPYTVQEIAPPTPVEEVGKEMREKFINDLDNALERRKGDLWDNVILPKYEENIAKEIEESDDVEGIDDMEEVDDDILDIKPSYDYPSIVNEDDKIPEMPKAEPEKNIVEKDTNKDDDATVKTLSEPAVSISDLNLDDIFDDDEDEDTPTDSSDELTEEEQKVEIARLQKVIKTQANPVKQPINLAEYGISSKPVSYSRILSNMNTKKLHSATWVLYNAGRPVTMTELSGPEIEKLDPDYTKSGLSKIEQARELFGIFYDHIIDANKPTSFEAWCKTILYDDIEHLYFAAYKASFSHGANLLPYTCEDDKHHFMQQQDVMSMVKFKDDTIKEAVNDIMKLDTTSEDLSIKSKLYQVSDDMCIAFKSPSLYNVVFENAALPENLIKKYEDLILYINCIEGIYQIDRTQHKLVRMATKVDPNNINKTIINKYKAYIAVLQRLSADEYSSIPSFVKEIKKDLTGNITFQTPETTCPNCGKKIEAETMDAMSLLFIRLRLQTILAL